MDFRVVAAPAENWAETAADALLVVVVAEGGASAPRSDGGSSDAVSGGTSSMLAGALGECLKQAVDDGDLELKPGRTVYLSHPAGLRAKRLVFAVTKDASAKSFRNALAAGLGVVKPLGVERLSVALAGAAAEAPHAEALVAAVGDAVYLYRHTKPSAPPAPKLAGVSWLVDRDALAAAREGLRVGMAIGAGVALAREWANRPANHCTPTMLGDEAARLGKEFGFKVDVLGPKEVEKLGMGSFLAVARGSEQPLRFIAMHYRGAGKSKGDKSGKGAAPVVLVGKGITFDTGGISLKGGAEMDEMKFDMGGAASVLGAMRAIAELQPAVDVVGLIASTENMPDGRAVKPGDVVTSMSGQTIEILNTDAEGRLVLCDALTYAERFEPQAVVDIATLTGACVVALGHHHSGLFTADDTLAADLIEASRTALDPCWRMPLDEEYDDALKSNFADMGNIGGRAGGAITAAMFLKRFTAKYPWAHLDIAGTAWKSGAAKGGTGRPVGLLTHFALSRAEQGAAAEPASTTRRGKKAKALA